jgi:hypothetical protein
MHPLTSATPAALGLSSLVVLLKWTSSQASFQKGNP